MVRDIRISGTGQLLDLAGRLRRAGHENIRQSYTRRIRRAAEPLKNDLQDTIRSMPLTSSGRKGRGGPSPTTRPFRASMADAVRLSVRTTGDPGAKVWIDRSRLPSDITPGVLNQINDTGRLRHPVYGNKRRWASQFGGRGFWDKTVQSHRSRITREVERVVDDVRRRIE
ncbi:hypothetical protein [Streptomyces pseudovenezuelae]|uniref:hypothetical protein n=1 Tax=Streptomyces pseudovenezuelae TaxID=67350 RepID=UPI0036DFA560